MQAWVWVLLLSGELEIAADEMSELAAEKEVFPLARKQPEFRLHSRQLTKELPWQRWGRTSSGGTGALPWQPVQPVLSDKADSQGGGRVVGNN